MIAFPGMLVGPAEAAGIAVPEDPNNYDKNKYIHFFILEVCQLGAPMPYPGVVGDNARVVAALSEDEARSITYKGLLEKGFNIGYSYGSPWV